MEIHDSHNPYESYTCDYGHSLQWFGNNLYSAEKCFTCKNNYNTNKKSVIRWNCKTCKLFFCQSCIKILKCKRCPVNHEYKKRDVKKYSYFVCDICFNQAPNSVIVWLDEICNLGFCTDCIGETEILDDNVFTFED